MKFTDKHGALKMRYIPLIAYPLAIAGAAFNIGFSAGPVIIIFIFGFMNFIALVLFAWLNDRVDKIESDQKKLAETIREIQTIGGA